MGIQAAAWVPGPGVLLDSALHRTCEGWVAQKSIEQLATSICHEAAKAEKS